MNILNRCDFWKLYPKCVYFFAVAGNAFHLGCQFRSKSRNCHFRKARNLKVGWPS